MTNFGLWSPFIDEAGVRSWYGRFPGCIERELRSYVPTAADFQPLGTFSFQRLVRAARSFVDQSVEPLNLRDHNPVHFEEVRTAGLQAFDCYFGTRANHELLAVRQAFEIALYFHDCSHCGSTLRADASFPEALCRRELGIHVSLEWVSALELVDFGKKYGLSLPMIAFMAAVVLATTFGGKFATERGIRNIPIVIPTHLISCMTRAADSNPREDFIGLMRKAMQVNIGEFPATGQLRDYHALLDSQLDYLDYLQGCHVRLDRAAGMALTYELGWERTRYAHMRQALRLKAGLDKDIREQIEHILEAEYQVLCLS